MSEICDVPGATTGASPVMELASYPTLLRLAKTPERLRRWRALRCAMDVLAAGQAAGQIRNVDYQDAKTAVSRAVEDAWKEVRGPHFYNGRWERLPSEVRDLDNTINVYGLHDVLAAYKRLTRSTLDHAAVREMRAFVVEVHPLAEAVAALKTAIVKGRAPSTGPSKPVNPNKVVKTCPCCFRRIAVVHGTMAHHGYQRPGGGWQTASCPGIRFKPLEVSNEGLVWVIGNYREELVSTKATFARRDHLDVLLVRRGVGVVKITPDMPTWNQELRIWCANIESEIRSLESALQRFEKVLAEWKPVEHTP